MKILFYPDRLDNPKRVSRIYRVLKNHPEIKYHNDPAKPHDLHIFWSYNRHSITPDSITLNAPAVINRGCYDISKVKVNRIFDDIAVDPLKHKGVCVEKIDQQGRHKFHRVITCPQQPKPGYVYQRLINSKENGLFVRYRVYWMDKITHVRKIWQTDPFETRIVKSEMVPVSSLFSPEKAADFARKCQAFGVNLAEMDVLWDGKPIVIDVNNIVGGQTTPGLSGTQSSLEIDNTIISYLKNYDNIFENESNHRLL